MSDGLQFPGELEARERVKDMREPYASAYLEGCAEKSDKECRYYARIGLRCAWLAGFNDTRLHLKTRVPTLRSD